MARTPVGRIAFRVEGNLWNAYWAPSQNSMDGAVHLGALLMSLAEIPAVKDAFMGLMQSAFEISVRQATGETASFAKAVPAPERERAGRD